MIYVNTLMPYESLHLHFRFMLVQVMVSSCEGNTHRCRPRVLDLHFPACTFRNPTYTTWVRGGFFSANSRFESISWMVVQTRRGLRPHEDSEVWQLDASHPRFFEKVSTVIMHLAGSKKWPHLKVCSRVESYIYTHMQRKWYMYLEKQPNSMGSEIIFFSVSRSTFALVLLLG